MVTLLQAGLTQLPIAWIGSPLPNAGEGPGGEGDSSLLTQLSQLSSG